MVARKETQTLAIFLESERDDMTIFRAWSRSGKGEHRVEIDTQFHTSVCSCEGGVGGNLCDHQKEAIRLAYGKRAADAALKMTDRELDLESGRYLKAVLRARAEVDALYGKGRRRDLKAANGREFRAIAWMDALGDEIGRRAAYSVAA